MAVWITVLAVGLITAGLKAIGPVAFAARGVPPWLGAISSLAGPALLTALVVSAVFAADRGVGVTVDARAAGLLAAVAAVALRAPLVLVVLCAAGTTALLRWGGPA
jgi:branched-subunit amino acid transport protein